mmetsp:Transcript_11401/g.34370  ORF Transcript_11401/g.34370 Transcript_11401/m.34370 type:complete len:238 (+) Transcript_11401:1097-1810(+)
MISASTPAGNRKSAVRISGMARKGWKFRTTRSTAHSRIFLSAAPSSVPGMWKRQYCSSNSGAVAGKAASIRLPMASKSPPMPRMSAIFSRSRALDAGASKAAWFSEYMKSRASSKAAWQDCGRTSVRSLPRVGVPPSCSVRAATLMWLSKKRDARARRKACRWYVRSPTRTVQSEKRPSRQFSTRGPLPTPPGPLGTGPPLKWRPRRAAGTAEPGGDRAEGGRTAETADGSSSSLAS